MWLNGYQKGLRYFPLMILAVAVAACSGTAERDLGGDFAKPEQMPAPVLSDGPLTALPGVSLFDRQVVSVSRRQPNAVYRRVGPPIDVETKDFEIPRVGARKEGVDSRKLKAPDNVQRTVSQPQPQSWAGSSLSFDSINFEDNAANTGFYFIPPDSHAAAGPNHVVAVTNTTMEVRSKDGTFLIQDSLKNFFTPGNGFAPPLTNTFDPKVLYDQYENRWVLITMETTRTIYGDATDTSRMFMAVSVDSNPMNGWYLLQYDSRDGATGFYWADYPGFAVDEEAIYITTNLFSFAGNSWGGVRLWLIPKGSGNGGLYDGGTSVVSELEPYAEDGIAQTTQPTHMYGTGPDGVGVFLVAYSGITDQAPGINEYIQVMRLDDPLTDPTFTLQYVGLGDIEPLSSALPDMPQAVTNTTVSSNDRRALDALWRNDAIWLTATIDPSSGPDAGEATAMWVKINTTNLEDLSLSQLGQIGGEDIAAGTFTTFPSIAVNASEDVVIGFSASASSIYPGAYFTAREAGDDPGVTGPSVTVHEGVDYYVRTFGGSRNRWGDYSATVVDPVDDCFWVFNEWADTRGWTDQFGEDGSWATSFTRTCPGDLPPPTCSATYNYVVEGLPVWQGFALPCDPSPNITVADVFSDWAQNQNYIYDWIVYGRDNTSGTYYYLNPTDTMAPNEAYWILGLTDTTVQLAGENTPGADYDLTSATPDGWQNFLGHNLNSTVSWADVQVVDVDGTSLSLAEFDPYIDTPKKDRGFACDESTFRLNDCVLSRKMYKWNGTAHQPFDGMTDGAIGELNPFDTFWVKAFKSGIKLRIPAAGSTPNSQLASSSLASYSIEASGTDKKPKKKQSWFIRLIAESGNRQDPGNVLGQLDDAEEGLDYHDLEEPAPLDASHFSVLFTNPEFDVVNWGYTSDFRPVTKMPQGSWPFKVRASEDIGEITLRWEGESRLFENTWLEDLQTGEMIRAEPGGGYTFAVEGGEAHFRFVVK